jgi:hypothetical protein
MNIQDQENSVHTFLSWGTPVSVDARARLLRELPFAQPEDLVEIPLTADPTEEDLEARVSSY